MLMMAIERRFVVFVGRMVEGVSASRPVPPFGPVAIGGV